MKKYMFVLVSMFIILILAACGTNTNNPEQNNDSPIDENIGDNENSNIEDPANDEELVDNDENESNNESENEDHELITETGIYTGQADPHTIEIDTADGPLAFQLTIEARDDIEALVEGEEVTYEYTEDGDTRTIESIRMSE